MDSPVEASVVVEKLGKRFQPRSPEDSSLLSAVEALLLPRAARRETWALRDISFSVERGETVGIVGRNGAGKSVLLSLVAGLLRPSEGEVRIRGHVHPFFQMTQGLHGRLSVEANVRLCAALLGLAPSVLEDRLGGILAFSGLADRRAECAGELSSGLSARIPFSVALHADLDVLLIDEMFLVGDAAFREKCFEEMDRLRDAGKTFLIAAHDAGLISRFCRRCLVLDEGRLVADGPARPTVRRYLDGLGGGRSPQSAVDREALSCHGEARRGLPEALRADGVECVPAAEASDEDLLRAHSRDWLSRLKANDLSPEEEEAWSLPGSRDLMPSAWRECGGTLQACRLALAGGVGVFIGGGLHHAVATHGRGYCVANDVVVALRTLMSEGRVRRPLIVDLDAHQGDGTARLFAEEPAVFTFSMHNRCAYPPRKASGSLDVELVPGAGDETYLALLDAHLPGLMTGHRPDFIVYLAGADPYAGDPVGGLALSLEALASRDKKVFQAAADGDVPIVVVAAGGYGPVHELVSIRRATAAAAFAAFPHAPRRVVV